MDVNRLCLFRASLRPFWIHVANEFGNRQSTHHEIETQRLAALPNRQRSCHRDLVSHGRPGSPFLGAASIACQPIAITHCSWGMTLIMTAPSPLVCRYRNGGSQNGVANKFCYEETLLDHSITSSVQSRSECGMVRALRKRVS